MSELHDVQDFNWEDANIGAGTVGAGESISILLLPFICLYLYPCLAVTPKGAHTCALGITVFWQVGRILKDSALDLKTHHTEIC